MSRKIVSSVLCCMQGTVQVSLSDASGMRLSMASANDVVIPSGDLRSDGASDRKQFEALQHGMIRGNLTG